MNIRQQKYKKNRLAGMSAYQAAIKAGYRHATAINAYKNIEKRLKFDELLVKHGLDNQTVVKVLGDGLNATKSVVTSEVVSGESSDHRVSKVLEVPDHGVRHKFLETFLKLRGDLKDLAPGNSVSVVVMQNIQVGDKTLEFNIGTPVTASDPQRTA
jgi:hypothetical protein